MTSTLHRDSLETEDPLLEGTDGTAPPSNASRDGLQEEGSHHQPVVFVGGPGYVPPNSLRQRPPLEAGNPSWQTRPLGGSSGNGVAGGPSGSGILPPIESRYPVHQQSPWDRNYRNPFNMTRVQREYHIT